jgi:NAD+ kinase
MTVGLFVNLEKDPLQRYAREVGDFLTSRGHTVSECRADGALSPMDFMVVLGGDGTMLRAARLATRYAAQEGKGIPLLGINLGYVGHLTDVGKDEGLQAVERVLAGKYGVQKRMMLEADGYVALNEIVVKGRRLTRFCIHTNGKPVADFRADGIIAATPTGSTAYNRSAGGPLLLPESEMIAVTPICPNPSAQPLVLDGNCEIQITADIETTVTPDGEKGLPLSSSKNLVIKRATHTALFIRTNP